MTSSKLFQNASGPVSSAFSRRLIAGALCLAATSAVVAQSGSSLNGTITDAKGNLLPRASVTVRNDATGKQAATTADATGKFSLANLAPGTYTVDVNAPGFTTAEKRLIQIADGQSTSVALSLQIASASDEIEVDANATKSVAAALAPMDALLGETSARTEITAAFIQNFTSPIADYGEAVNYAPSTFTLSSDGVGLGQSKTYFRGFPDGDYDIDFDGIPFYDTNSPTHHSWAFFPSLFLGGIDFDRSPGTASTIGPTPFGGSIHLLSKDLSPLDNVRATVSGGSFNTYLYDVAYDTGAFGPGHKFNSTIDVHHLQSHGYQSLNNQVENAGDIKLEYKIGPRTVLTGYSGVIWVDANTPNFSATRCQMYGVQAGYNCFINGTSGPLSPYTGTGINFLNTNNSDPLLYLDTKYNFYHIPTDFEYVGLHKEMAHNFNLDVKGYTYNYDNSEIYANATTITETKGVSDLGLPSAPCNVAVVKKGVSAIPCGVDKYNSYRKYGETSTLSQVSKLGIFRGGIWYEWAKTNRHQYPTDPLNNYADQLLPNFAEMFWTNSYQPFAEYEFHVGSKLSVTPGVKFAYYTITTKQFADNGKTIGNLGTGTPVAGSTTGATTPGTGNPNAYLTNGGSYFSTLPSFSVNYRVKNNLSVYGQIAQGSIVPPSNVFDYAQPSTTNSVFKPVLTLPKQQLNTTYQFGGVYKAKRFTLDADYYHIYFDNSYSSFTDPASGEPVFYAQPASTTQGLEGESNIYLTHGLSIYLNASYDSAVYTGALAVSCSPASATCTSATPQYTATAPSGQNVAYTPSDVETEGLTYQRKDWDLGLFNKRVGTYYQDNGQYHNQFAIAPFSVTNIFLNYTVRSNNRFNQTKFRLSFNNLLNSSSQTGVSLATGATGQVITANGTTYSDPFNATFSTTPINGQDNVSILPGRSIMLTATFGLTPRSR